MTIELFAEYLLFFSVCLAMTCYVAILVGKYLILFQLYRKVQMHKDLLNEKEIA